MSLFEKIDLEPIESAEPLDAIPQSTRQFSNQTLTVKYQPGKKFFVLCSALAVVPFLIIFFNVEDAVVPAAVFVSGAWGFWALYRCLEPRDFTFTPDSIVTRGYLGTSRIPTHSLILTVTEQAVTFYLGSEKNLRESVQLYTYLVTPEDCADVVKYAKDVYQVVPHIWEMGEPSFGKGGVSKLAVEAYHEAVGSYRSLVVLLITCLVVVLIGTEFSDNFHGLALQLPAYPIRLAGITLTIAAFFLLRHLTPAGAAQKAGNNAVPLTLRFKQLDSRTTTMACVSCGVAAVGVILFLLFANLLDFFLFSLVAALFLWDFYPRLSAWEEPGAAQEEAVPLQPVLLPRRSLQVSLVLMGALSVASYGQNPHYLYNSRQDCQQDWGDQDCREVPDSGSNGVRHYYGPRYGSGGRAPHSVGAISVSRGGFGSMGGFHASFGG